MSSFFLGLIGGAIAWFMTAFIAQPLSHFLSLRTRAATLMAMYEEPKWGGPDEPPIEPSDARTAERNKAFEECGAELIAFAFANSTITRLFHRMWPKSWRMYPRNAGFSLMNLAEVPPASPVSADICQKVGSYLRLHYRP